MVAERVHYEDGDEVSCSVEYVGGICTEQCGVHELKTYMEPNKRNRSRISTEIYKINNTVFINYLFPKIKYIKVITKRCILL